MKPIAVAICALALMSVPALAQDSDDHEFPMTMEAFFEAHPDIEPEAFAQIDADADGEVSEDEYNQARENGLIEDQD
ncbi:MAG: hypothetical protein HLUCCA12_14205 [Rhodobacteraceae bacterium HLUCCA12]|nr:MAG: hypothetical protein HLUCCA12_14205 [Rhodobacteraceae bacterium HLUCCA12]